MANLLAMQNSLSCLVEFFLVMIRIKFYAISSRDNFAGYYNSDVTFAQPLVVDSHCIQLVQH